MAKHAPPPTPLLVSVCRGLAKNGITELASNLFDKLTILAELYVARLVHNLFESV